MASNMIVNVHLVTSVVKIMNVNINMSTIPKTLSIRDVKLFEFTVDVTLGDYATELQSS